MNIKIHRGTQHIGGSVVEIFTQNTRIFIDLGSPLPDGNGDEMGDALELEGVTSGEANCDGVLFSHYHGDHIGMLGKLLPYVPFYMGPVSKEIYLILQKRVRHGIPQIVEAAKTFSPGEKFAVGDFLITPYVVDHSAFDAYMFLVEAEGKRILYTGDFRAHGFRGKAVLPMLRKYVGQVDVLITEGTMLSRGDVAVKTEHQLQADFAAVLKKYKYAFVICSSTNIDRIGSICQATPKGKYFICDEYQKTVLQKVDELCGNFTPLYSFGKALSYGHNLDEKLEQRGFCAMIRNAYTFGDLVNKCCKEHPEDTVIIYSMWRGYLEKPGNQYEIIMNKFQNIEYLHTSGHATLEAIIDVCNTVKPTTAIIPMHSENRHKMDEAQMPYHIEYLDDGEIYKL